jgi:hypothetical protein
MRRTGILAVLFCLGVMAVGVGAVGKRPGGGV